MKRFLLLAVCLGCVAPAMGSFFDIYTELSIDSVQYPVPNAPMQMSAQRVGSASREEYIQFKFGPQTAPGVALSAEGRDPGVVQPTSFFDIFLESFSSPGFRIDSFFDVYCSSGAPGQVGNVVSYYMAPDSFFDVFLEAYVPSAGGYQQIHVHGELNPAQPVGMSFGSNWVAPGTYMIDSFFDVFCDVYSTSNVGENYFVGYNPNLPLMTMSVEIIPEPATLALMALGLGVLGRRKRG